MKNSYIDSHNHPIAIDKTIYHAYRKTNGDHTDAEITYKTKPNSEICERKR
ncbi:hypothetical protein CU098_008505 [Rhizopus stolonifer]|uniref:Uncharacterized protein n=1 Tax=Rhizopus stolonifer TaxID=4846 RepID=A0A367IPS2_RHIST|nr:hypothetical protein CU098_008505 [Rhizopus stolonifer]